jgi:hypothetical protein
LDAFGNSLCNEIYTPEEIQDIRNTVGESIFQAIYQQNPIDLIDCLFADPIWGEYGNVKGGKRIAYLDPAFGGADFCALTIGCMDHGEDLIYIISGEIWRSTIDKTYDKVEKMCLSYNVSRLFVESNAAQSTLQYEFKRRHILVSGVNNVENKHFRILGNAKVNWEKLRFSKRVGQDYMKQLLEYSEISKHDDAADSLSGLIKAMRPGTGSAIKRYGGFCDLLRFRR